MRRTAISVAIAFVLMAGGDARADVLVPADPPSRAGSCFAAAGDVAATLRADSRGDRYMAASVRNGPWQRISPANAFLGRCPLVAAAVDGSAVVAGGGRIAVRPPGGRFGTPIRLDRSLEVEDVAVAPGGWAALVGRQSVALGAEEPVVVVTVAPDGRVRRSVVDRAPPGFAADSARVGIDASGTATVAWVREEPYGRAASVRVTRALAGAAWETPRDGGAVPLSPGGRPFALAVSPTGHTLLAWAGSDGVLAELDGVATRLAPARRTGIPAAALGADGSAIVAWVASAGDLAVAARTPDGQWAPPTTFPGTPATPRDATGLQVALALASDGRALVGWQSRDLDSPRALAIWGRPGSAWSAPVAVSPITGSAHSLWAWTDADGVPHLQWHERTDAVGVGRFRGVRLAPDSQAGTPDTSPPTVTARLPAHTARTRSGHVRLRIPVRCSEACDVRVRIIDRTADDRVIDGTDRAVPAGRRVLLRFSTDWPFAYRVLTERRARRPRLELLVADRAGNTVRRSRTLHVRVVDRPILGFLVGPDHSFSMYTRAGDRAVGRLVNALIRAVASGNVSQRELRHRFHRGIRAIETDVLEVDTPVRDAIYEALAVPLVRRGFDAEAVMG